MSDHVFKSIRLEDVDFLGCSDTLYSIDFRATGEGLDKEIPAMFKYENLAHWLVRPTTLETRHVVVNELLDVDRADYSEGTPVYHVATRDVDSASTSIYKRLPKISKDVKRIWVGVPHPDADWLSSANNIDINYSYDSFIKKNDKILQKQLLGDMSPGWRLISSQAELRELSVSTSNCFLKRRIGAGGYSVIDLQASDPKHIEKNITDTHYSDWYVEERATGIPCSAQAVLGSDGKMCIFGITEQYIEDGTIFSGAQIKDIETVPYTLKQQLLTAIERMRPILDGYEGFFGIDFMLNNDKLSVLEFNVRLTAATIPTLLRNGMGQKTVGEFHEDVESITNDDVVITKDHHYNTSDTIRFHREFDNDIGNSVFIQLSDCKYLPPSVDDTWVNQLKAIVVRSVSDVVEVSYHNFWPYGWTISFILSESHCVLSSWHEEKNVLIDVFCCKNFDHIKFSEDITSFFDATPAVDEVVKRLLA